MRRKGLRGPTRKIAARAWSDQQFVLPDYDLPVLDDRLRPPPEPTAFDDRDVGE